MTFKAGSSGNPTGRPRGAVSKRVQLAKLLEPYSKVLVGKMVELALNGDVGALRLCMDRLIPKVQREHIDIQLPKVLGRVLIPV